jgi:hypothetical protein
MRIGVPLLSKDGKIVRLEGLTVLW